MINEVTLVGRLGKDPELKKTANSSVCSLWIATSEVTYDKDKNKVEHTEWHTVTLFGNNAENAVQYLGKGSLVYIKGRIQSREYTDKEGIQRKAYEIIGNQIKFLSSNSKKETAPAVVDINNIPW